MTGIDYGPPVQGPFTVVWVSIDPIPGAEWEEHTAEVATEEEAVSLWQAAVLYANMRPVSIMPEPRWNRYTYDGHSPVTR